MAFSNSMVKMTEIAKATCDLQVCVKLLQEECMEIDAKSEQIDTMHEPHEDFPRPEAPSRGWKMAPVSARGMASASAKAPRPHTHKKKSHGVQFTLSVSHSPETITGSIDPHEFLM